MRIPVILMVLTLTSVFAYSQNLLRGKVMDSRTDMPLDGATIFNKALRINKKAAFDGSFAIIAMERDTIIFSSTGYRSDTIEITRDLINSGLMLGLKALPLVLDTVTITSNSYAQDSAQRRDEYSHFYKQHINNIMGGNTPAYGFGISVSPFSFLSRKERAKRRFKKQLEYNEQQEFIDFYFSASYVHRVTGLSGQELRTFMLRYRPAYKFVRTAQAEDMFRYINASFKKFKKAPASGSPR